MSDSAFIPQYPADEDKSQQETGSIIVQTRIRRSIWKIAFATLLLMAVGSATRVMNAGLACPDWPLCYGQLVPTQQMNLQVFLEWFHRLDAGLIGLSTLFLAGSSWWYRSQLPRWLPWANTFALSLILIQGALGAFTVTELLRFDIVTAHLGTALLFFITLLSIGTCLLPITPPAPPYKGGALAPSPLQGEGWGDALSLPKCGVKISAFSNTPLIPLTAAILIYIQSILGGLVGSQWALHQCFGNSELCTVMNNHIIGVVPATLSCIAVIVTIWRNPNAPKYCFDLAKIVGGFLICQILLGTATFRLHLQVETLTVAHQSIGAMLLGTLVILTVLLWRQNQVKLINLS
jgi:heme a synthase